ncbi:exodeoxyribonuclease III [Candidatus Woesearchaeota archaeon]|nr:exodeoxyribonuclease III [Candidatus Woesearchaeota archaeon]
MKIVSWNVNGIRACIKNGFKESVKSINPDILCLQETKLSDKFQLEMPELPIGTWNNAERKGYSGTAILSKQNPISSSIGIGIAEHERLDYRQEWDKDFLSYLKKLEKKKPVIACGDLNVAHKEIDLKNPKSNWNKTAGFTEKECKGMDNIINNGFIDTFRYFYPKEVRYSWWSYMFDARNKNIGWRIDYFIVSQSLKSRLKSAFILDKVLGSDHCPVGIEIG